ncbi:unnamed protein product [Lactuca virosa]|uniref:Uncharacterized protein n=1 Tax=Lactuca virosa TaxID=75947 RepID=A0AAU9LJS8_9ASTR|nr:unnamed protein product [Lactuca virosa]
MGTTRSLGRDLTTEEWESFEFRFRFVPEHGVQIPLLDASLYSPPEGKVGIPIALFEAGLRFPTTNLFNLIVREYGFSMRELTPIAINKIVCFELLCRALYKSPLFSGFIMKTKTLPTFPSYFSMGTTRSLGRDLTTEEWESFEFRFRFVPEHGVQIPLLDASLYSPPEGKVGIPIALFEAGLRFPATNLFNLIVREYGFSMRELTPIAINKIVCFELLCRAYI